MRRKKEDQSLATIEPPSEQANEPAATADCRNEAPAATREPGDEREYPPTPNPFEIKCDNAARVRLFEHRGSGKDDPYYRYLAFLDGKPSDKVRQFMKDEGVQWNKPKGSNSWNVIIDYQTRNQDRLHAERVFHKVVDMILEEKGLVRGPELERF